MGVFILVQHEEIRAKFKVMRYLFNLHLHVGQWVSLFIDEMQTGVIHPVFLDSALDAAFHIVLVIFSPFYDNLADIKYTDADTDLKTISLVKYDEDGSSSSDDDVPEEPEDRIYITVGDAKLKGISRRELFFDADNISTTIEKNGEEVELEDDEFKEHLKKKGLLNLNKYATKSTVDGEIIDNKMYEYKIDYDLGDIVLLDDCIHQGQKRVSEMIYSHDSEGQKMYPSFEDLEDDEDEED